MNIFFLIVNNTIIRFVLVELRVKLGFVKLCFIRVTVCKGFFIKVFI